jgi:hypothetical protein
MGEGSVVNEKENVMNIGSPVLLGEGEDQIVIGCVVDVKDDPNDSKFQIVKQFIISSLIPKDDVRFRSAYTERWFLVTSRMEKMGMRFK